MHKSYLLISHDTYLDVDVFHPGVVLEDYKNVCIHVLYCDRLCELWDNKQKLCCDEILIQNDENGIGGTVWWESFQFLLTTKRHMEHEVMKPG
jgi:hypothetical protein